MERLEHQRTDAECIFRVYSDNEPVPIDQWAACRSPRIAEAGPADLGTILRLVEDGNAYEIDDLRVSVPWPNIAALDPDCLAGLGLPKTRSLRVELYGQGSFTDATFRIRLDVKRDTGQPISIATRQGAVANDGHSEWTLGEPFFSIIERVQALNSMGDAHPEAKMLAWGELRRLLPDDTSIDGYLNETSIVLASGIELQIRLDSDGFPTVDPIPGRISQLDDIESGPRRRFLEVLPKARVADFQRRFASLHRVSRRYSAGAGSYVIFSRSAVRVLKAVRELQGAPGPERLQAIQSIDSFIRARLDADEQTEDLDLDEVFHSEGFGDRVRGIGAWQPRTVPWVRRQGNVWIPADEPGTGDSGLSGILCP